LTIERRRWRGWLSDGSSEEERQWERVVEGSILGCVATESNEEGFPVFVGRIAAAVLAAGNGD